MSLRAAAAGARAGRALLGRRRTQPRLVRWGTQLHDRFMLPHFVEQDFRDVLEELRARGLRASTRRGSRRTSSSASRRSASSRSAGVGLELRHALEPWHVLGEEPGARRHGALRRLVARAPAGARCAAGSATATRVACNGRALPLHPTGTHGEYVAGVRYRAWQPPTCLHPTIPVHAPLVFDVVDTWLERSLGGCTYHVAHPGGRAYERLPGERVRGRGAARRALLAVRPHAGARQARAAPAAIPEFPLTLDLRRS